MIGLVICLIVALVIGGAVMGVVRAVLAMPGSSAIAPYGGVIYALIVLLMVLLVISYCFGYPGHVVDFRTRP
jgi:hypothetical protein